MTLNDAAIVTTIAALHDDYERALTANDVEALSTFFWDSPHVVRYGVAEQLYGAAELRAFRQGHTPPFTARRIARREICTFGAGVATVMCEIEMLIGGVTRRSRQSQTWVQLPDAGWRVVAAHVSAPLAAPPPSPWAAYADAMARTLALEMTPEQRSGVIANLDRTAAIAASLLAVTLPDEAEPAPVFSA
jgi:hypothetical protein